MSNKRAEEILSFFVSNPKKSSFVSVSKICKKLAGQSARRVRLNLSLYNQPQ